MRLLLLIFLFTQITLLSAQKFTEEQISTKVEKVANSDFNRLTSTLKAQVNFDKLIAAIEDFNNYKNWYVDCLDSKILSINTVDSTGYTYFVNDLPWPYDNRDLVNNFKVHRTSNHYHMTFKAVEGHLPNKEDLVRINDSEGSWDLTLDQNGLVTLVYMMYVNPGNTLPTGIANNTMKSAQRESLSKLINLVLDKN